MKPVFASKPKSNRLLQILIIISVAVHGVLFMHIAGLYRSGIVRYIEVSLEDLSKPFYRNLPRPIRRPQEIEPPKDVQKVIVTPQRIPRIEPAKIDPVDTTASNSCVETIGVPHLAGNGSGGICSIGEIVGATEFSTAKSYYEMVVLKIEARKKYPESAKTSMQEGRVTVGFTLTLQGTVKNVKVVRPCQHTVLNEAAVQAVKDAAPFPRPPYRFFTKDIPMELNIIFETT
jgi:protein TonB